MEMFLLREKADVHFVFESGERIPAHKHQLAAESDVFDTMFNGSLPEKGDVKITDASAAAFKEFLRFFYSQWVELTMENVDDVMSLGDKYNVSKCIEFCDEFLEQNLTTDNVCQIYSHSIVQNQMKLKEKCEKEMLLKSSGMFKSQGFIECSRSILENIIKLDGLGCIESDVFEACMSWTKHASNQIELTKEIIKEYLGDLFYAIRFRSMTHDNFIDLLVTYNRVFSSYEIYEILEMIRDKEYEPKLFNGCERNPSFEWDNYRGRIICCRIESLLQHQYFIGNVDITHFTTNKPLLFEAFTCSNLLESDNGEEFDCKMPVYMTIATVTDCGQNKTKTLNVIHSEKIKLELYCNTHIILQKPVFIRSGIKHEIRLYLKQSVWGDQNFTREVIQLRDDVQIKFDYDFNSSGITKGLIWKFCFNLVDQAITK